MLNLFGKKPDVAITKEQAADQAISENLDKEIVVHVMPKQFLNVHADAKKAKSTGILILIGGVIFLVAAGFGFYYLVFVYKPSPKVPVESTNTDQVATNTVAVVEQVATVTPSTNLNIEPVATTTTTTVVEIVASSTTGTINLTPAKDTDQDGLTDDEEILIGTNLNQQDTDGDGFNDLAEVIKLYNPTGVGKLIDSNKIRFYANSVFAYNFNYPAAWAATALGDETIKVGPAVQINPDLPADSVNTQFIQINVSTNAKQENISDWYKEQFSLTTINNNNLIDHRDANGQVNWLGIKNQDGLTVYLTDKSNRHIYTINYDLSLGATLNFPNIFNLIVDSFTLTN